MLIFSQKCLITHQIIIIEWIGILFWQLRETTRRFAVEELGPIADEIDRTDNFAGMRVSGFVSARFKTLMHKIEKLYLELKPVCEPNNIQFVQVHQLFCQTNESERNIFHTNILYLKMSAVTKISPF